MRSILRKLDKDEKIHYLSLLVKKLRTQAIVDDLTSIYNKGYFRQRLKEEVERAYRFKLPLSLAIFDVDDFKKYNDTYGHLEGDYVLRKISKHLFNNSRRIDICARYGGEEFVVILPGTKKEHAFMYLDRVRDIISQITFKRQVTISVGIAELKPNMTPEQLVELADSRLYTSKKTGKNRITTI